MAHECLRGDYVEDRAPVSLGGPGAYKRMAFQVPPANFALITAAARQA